MSLILKPGECKCDATSGRHFKEREEKKLTNTSTMLRLRTSSYLAFRYGSQSLRWKKFVKSKSPVHLAMPFEFKQHLLYNLSRHLHSTSPHCSKVFSSSDFWSEDYSQGVDELSDEHLRIQLYPNESDQVISKLYNANSLQDIFSTFNSIDPDQLNEKHSSQALASIWDLQKLLHKISLAFDPDFDNRAVFIDQVIADETFKSIASHVISNSNLLEDEPLAASFLSLKRLNYSLETPECQQLLQECLKRKDTFALPAVSRITVCLRNEAKPMILIRFLPCLFRHMTEMSDDLSVRLVSISLRNSQQLLTEKFAEVYREKLAEILKQRSFEFETVTLCKALLCTYEISRDVTVSYKVNKETGHNHLIRQIGAMLVERVPNIDQLDLINLQRFLEYGPQEPRQLVDALIRKVSRLIEEQDETPLLDLLHCFLPSVRKIPARNQLSIFARDYLDQCKDFGAYGFSIAKILKALKLNDKPLFDRFWLKAEKYLKQHPDNIRTVLRFTQDYLTFVRVNYCAYRNFSFETTAKQVLYSYIRNHRNSSTSSLVSPSSVARVFAFIIAFASPMEPLFTEIRDDSSFISFLDNRFADNFKILDLKNLARGIETCNTLRQSSRRHYPGKYFDQMLDLISIVDERLTAKLLRDEADLTAHDLNSICKAQSAVTKDDSPIIQEAIRKLSNLSLDQLNSRLCKDITVNLLTTTYNEPRLFHNVKDYIWRYYDCVSPDLVAKFVFLAYSLGYEGGEGDGFFHACNNIIQRYWIQFGALELLQAMQSLCFYRALGTDLVQQVFSVQFLDQVDEEQSISTANASNPLKVRMAFMELNRAVCLDMPQAEVPWFHEKFCQDVRTTMNPRTSHIHGEVFSTLCEVLNNPDYIQRGCLSPYAYEIDFLIEFDEKGRPIKKIPQKRSLFSFKKQPEVAEAAEKVAILVLPDRSFTRNVRNLRGYSKLRQRHLEMLGYRVVHVDPFEWNSMYMSIPTVKNDYLEQCIYTRKEARN